MYLTDSKLAAFGVYPRAAELQSIVGELNHAGFQNEDICLLLAPGHPIATQVRDMRTLNRVPDPALRLETLLRWLSQLGAVVISNLFFFARSPDFLHALVEAPQPTALGGHRGALAVLGIPERELGRLGTRISDGGSLIYVNCSPTALSEPAIEIFRKTGAEESSLLQ